MVKLSVSDAFYRDLFTPSGRFLTTIAAASKKSRPKCSSRSIRAIPWARSMLNWAIRTHVSQEKWRSALLDLNHVRLRRNAVGYHFEVARTGFHVGRYIEQGFHRSRVANPHSAVVMRTAVENVAGSDVG